MSKRRGTGGAGLSSSLSTATAHAYGAEQLATYGWEWALDALANDPDRHSRIINVSDTIVRPRRLAGGFGSTTCPGDWQWIFTRKNGTISKKKLPLSTTAAGAATIDRVQLMNKVRERLVQVASRVRAAKEQSLTSALSPPPFIAALYFQDSDGSSGDRDNARLLQPAELLEWLELLQQESSSSQQTAEASRRVLGLQAFIPNDDRKSEKRAQPSHVLVKWQAVKSSGEVGAASIERRLGDFASNIDEASKALPLELPPSVETAIRQMTDAIVGSLACAAVGNAISSADLVFVVDESLKVWLRHVPRVCVSINHMAPTSSSAMKAALPTLQQAPTAETGAVSKCSGEFCRTPISSLPGLYRLCRRHNGEQAKDDAIPLADAGQRFKVSNNSLLLAHAEIAFLHGDGLRAGHDDEAEDDALALRWQEADNVLRAEIGRAQPAQFYKQVLVCANCHRMYSEINRVRELGFRRRPRSAAQKTANTRHSASGVEADSSNSPTPAQGEDYAYDKMFLKELAKQSEALEKEPRGPEHDEGSVGVGSSRQQGQKKDASLLPSLSGSVRSSSVTSKPSKKVSALIISANNNVSSSNNNNQALYMVDEGAATRVKTLENELAAAEVSLSTAEAQTRKLTNELIQTRSQCAAMLKEKDEQHRRQLLERDLEFHSTRQQQTGNGVSGGGEEVSRLIETIDTLNRQLDDATAARDSISQQLTLTHRAELKRVHDSHRAELEALRLAEHTAKEQTEALQAQLLTLQTQAQVASAQAKHATAALDDLTARTLPGFEEKNRRLERQLADALAQQQSAAAKGKISATPAEVEAVEKRWRNKVEYLKAQLASEMKCKEELGAHLAHVTAAIEKGKQEKKQALLEQEQALKVQLERAREAFTKESEAAAVQLATAQAKVVTLQANVTDLVQELTVTKSKEANARLAMDKMAEEQVRLTRQLVDTEATLEALQEKTKAIMSGSSGAAANSAQAASEETNRVQMEALMRRLDNERQYLKNQLEGEQEERDKSQQQVAALQRELRELQSTAEIMTRELEQKMSADAAERLRSEHQLRSALQCAEEEKALLGRQLREVQSKFAQAREQALLDRDEAESARREMLELRTQAAAASEEAAREKQAARAASERMAASVAAVKSSLQGVEQEKNVRIQRLEGEVALYLSKLAAAEGETLVREDKWAAERLATRRETSLKLLAMALRLSEAKARLRAVGHAFRLLSNAKAQTELECELNRRHASHVEAVEEQLSEQMALKCDQITQALNDERMAALKSMKNAHDRDREELHEYFQQEKVELQEELAAQHAAQLQKLTEKFEAAMSDGAASALAEARELRASRDAVMRERDLAQADAAQWQRTCTQLSEAAKETLETQQREWVTKEAVLMDVMRALECRLGMQREDATGKLMAAVESLTVAHSKAMTSLQTDHERRARELVAKETARLVAKAQAECSQLGKQHANELEALKSRHQEQLEQEREQVNAQWAREATARDETHASALKSAVERVEARAQQQLDALQRELNERKATAVMQCTSKWQRALEEQQERLEADKQLAYQQGVRDREAEWQQAAVQIKAKQKEELDEVQREAVRAIQAAEERHCIQFQVKLEDAARVFEAKLASEVERATLQTTESERQAAQKLVASSVEQARAEMATTHASEIQGLRNTLTLEFQQQFERQTAVFNEERLALIDQRTREFADLQRDLGMQWTRRLEDAIDSKQRDLEAQMEKLREELADESDDARRLIEQQFAEQLASALDKQREELAREQEDAIAQVHEDSDKLLEQVELAMDELKSQKERLERELVGLRASLEEAEDGQYDARETIKAVQKRAAFEHLHFIILAHKQSHDHADSESKLKSTFEAQRQQLEHDAGQERSKWREDAAQAAAAWKQVCEAHEAMLQALTSYKRDELVAHRSASAMLANEISIVSKQMDEVFETQAALERDVAQLQAEAQHVEAALRQLMLQSSTSSSSSVSSEASLNMAVVAKKRRLNEEFEALLEQMERKKSEQRAVDKTLAALRSRREDKERELKALERTLVEILVQQQKQVLALLSGVQGVRMALTVQ